jgi:hypothetical protein
VPPRLPAVPRPPVPPACSCGCTGPVCRMR